MLLKNPYPYTVYVGSDAVEVEAGKTIEITGPAARSLVDQGWEKTDKPAATDKET